MLKVIKNLVCFIAFCSLVAFLMFRYFPRLRYFEISDRLYLVKPADCSFNEEKLIVSCSDVKFNIKQVEDVPLADTLNKAYVEFPNSGYSFYFDKNDEKVDKSTLFILNYKLKKFFKVSTLEGRRELTLFFYDHETTPSINPYLD